ncbi:heme-binding protein 2 [Patella vulgata]|uniref:heme-binding protein 2 n=1 Tax=Patella vulgata TaxID=6465 RepID=UPI00217F6EF1|nr:heme-binding protein 2 [Patella vulgata]
MLKVVSLVVLLQVVHGNLITGFDVNPSYRRGNRVFNEEQNDGSQQASSKPDFCNDLDCPAYTVLEDVQGKYQKRRYQASNWVTTQLLDMDYQVAQSTMFRKLFLYISGNNTRGEKIAMTSPVITRLIPGPGPACESNFTMSFYISNTVANPPTPTDTTVKLTQLPALVAYVRSFPGFATSDLWVQEATQLAQDLNGKSFNSAYFYTAGYDGPFRVVNRHNEVWFLAENAKPKTSTVVG